MVDKTKQASFLLQEDLIEDITKKIGKDNWLSVYNYTDIKNGHIAVFSALIPVSRTEEVIQGPAWDLSIGDGVPGFRYQGEKPLYERFHDLQKIEPFIFRQYFFGLKPQHTEVSEEFRHYHNLFNDALNNKYIHIDGDGNEEDVVILSDNNVQVHLHYLKQYLAAREMNLVVYFDHRRFSNLTLEELGDPPSDLVVNKDDLILVISLRNHRSGDGEYESFSRLLGKKVIQGYGIEKSGVWPFNEIEEGEGKFVSFVISTKEDGSLNEYSCDSSKLADYFGKNPEAPHYLTPVFFRSEVLAKYYANPKKFSVEDGYLRCGALWGLEIDNNHEKHVVAFLGDLGRSLSYNEQMYWRHYNIPPEGTISKVAWERGFMAEFTDPQRNDLLFKYNYEIFYDKWNKKIGFPLFKPLSDEDFHHIQTLRIPLSNDQAEFDNQILSLTKILVDSINEAEIQKLLSDKREGEKGISKLERYLKEQDVEEYTPHIAFLQNLQALRSTGVAHRKSKNYRRIAQVFKIGERDLISVFDDILSQSIALLAFLNTTLR
ncbi:MAG: hypothetical protein FVQ83_16850 [Chloroflexi bacterium]|nr:hypothetical protein [Chloroflexota bacterium]